MLVALNAVTVADSIESLIAIIGALVTGAVDWIGTSVSMMVAHPLLLGLCLIPMLSVGIGLIRRFFL